MTLKHLAASRNTQLTDVKPSSCTARKMRTAISPRFGGHDLLERARGHCRRHPTAHHRTCQRRSSAASGSLEPSTRVTTAASYRSIRSRAVHGEFADFLQMASDEKTALRHGTHQRRGAQHSKVSPVCTTLCCRLGRQRRRVAIYLTVVLPRSEEGPSRKKSRHPKVAGHLCGKAHATAGVIRYTRLARTPASFQVRQRPRFLEAFVEVL